MLIGPRIRRAGAFAAGAALVALVACALVAAGGAIGALLDAAFAK